MGTTFDLVWRAMGPSHFEQAFIAVQDFTFAGVEGFSDQKLTGLVPLVETHDLMHANVTRYVEFMNDASDDFIGECAPLAESVTGNLLRAMAFAWHLVASPGLYEQAGSVIGRFMPVCRDIVDEKRMPRSTDDLTPTQLGVCVRWLHSVSRYGSCALLAERGSVHPVALGTRVTQAELQVKLARAWSRCVVDPRAAVARRLNEFVAKLDLYRALCDRTEREAKNTRESKRCEALYEQLGHLAKPMPVRHAYRYKSAERRLAKSDPTRAIDPLLHDRMVTQLSTVQADSDRACVVIAALNGAVAKQDRAAIDRCIQELQSGPATLIEHKSLLTVEAAVVAATAVPPLAAHFRREILLVPYHRERIERVPVIHGMASSLLDADGVSTVLPTKSTFLMSPRSKAEPFCEDFGVHVGQMVKKHFNDDAGGHFLRVWEILHASMRSRLRAKMLNRLMEDLPISLCDELCQKGPLRGKTALDKKKRRRDTPVTVHVATLCGLLSGPTGRDRTGEFFEIVTHARATSAKFKLHGFICNGCGSVQYIVGRSLWPSVACRVCGRRDVGLDRLEIPKTVRRCPLRGPRVLDFVRVRSATTMPGQSDPADYCPCKTCRQKKLLIDPSPTA